MAGKQAAAQFAACGRHDLRARCLGGAARDDVDHAIDRIGAPDRRPGTADHLDTLDEFERDVVELPEHAGIDRRVKAAPVLQHQQLVRVTSAEAADRHAPAVVGEASHMHARCHAQRLGQVGGAAAPNVLRADHMHRSSSTRQRLRALGHRGHNHIHELFKAHVEEICAVARGRGLGESGQRRDGGKSNQGRLEAHG